MKKIIILICLSCTTIYSQIQGIKVIDSLKEKLKSTNEDTSQVKILADLSKQYYRFDTEQGIYFGKRALVLSDKLKWDEGVALSNNVIGTNYAVRGDLATALEYFHKSLDKSIEIKDEQGIANLSNNIGNIYRKLNKLDKSILYLKRAIDINVKLNNKIDLYKGYSNIGITYSLFPDIKNSNEYFYKALELAAQLKNEEFKYQILINISSNYSSIKNYCKALKLSYEALSICEKANYNYDIATITGSIGLIYFQIANDSLLPKENCTYYNSNIFANLKQSEKYLLESLNLLEKVKDFNQIQETAKTLSIIYERLGNYKSSLEYFKIYKIAFDSINFKNNNQKIELLENKREIELRDKQIKIQNLEIEKKDAKLIYHILVFVLIIIIIFIFTYIGYIKYRNKKEFESNKAKMLAEEAIKESQRMLKLISDNLPKTYIFQFKMDSDGKFSFLFISSGVERVHYGVNVDDILKNAEVLLETIDDTMKSEFFNQVSLSAQYLTDFEMDLKMLGKNSEIIWMNIYSRPRAYENNTIIWDGTAADITDRKNAENELIEAKAKAEESEKLKSAFLSNISHEIRTPLNGILGFTSLLKFDDLDKDEKLEYISFITKSSKRLELMVDNIIEVSKISTGQVSITKSNFSIKQFIDDIFFQNSVFIKDNNLEFTTDIINCEENYVYSDEGKLMLIFNSLINNSVKFTNFGEITIGCTLSDNNYNFFVKDTGIGIAENLQEKIFENFFQVDSSISRKYEGAGLGLSICKGLMELLGGKIWVESEVGKGSTFWFSLPIDK